MCLSSRGVIDEIQLDCHSDILGECFYMQISAVIIEKAIVFKSMQDSVTKYCLYLYF